VPFVKFRKELLMYRNDKPGRMPLTALLSGFWELFNIPTKRVILDGHLIKSTPLGRKYAER
jgi:hypothetical protein